MGLCLVLALHICVCIIAVIVAHASLLSALNFFKQFRYFLQPFLILYYVPLYMLRTWTSPKKREERRALHEEIMNDFKRGVQAAGAAHEAGYWPFQLNGEFLVVELMTVLLGALPLCVSLVVFVVIR